ncbi:META domain-containing protein [Microbacterium sp. P05]|uniref:META domain-containing protein n=1 Tax=Microbacterium sp. P05 TaxID=3366948 RepID=UPI0037454EC4
MKRNVAERWVLIFGLTGALTVMVGCQASPDSATPTSPGPVVACSSEIPFELGCASYRSVSGSDGSTQLEWLSDTPLRFEAQSVDQAVMIVVDTPCNTLTLDSPFSDGVIVVEETAATLKGCDPQSTAKQNWVEAFFGSSVTYERTGTELILRNGRAEVVLTPSS